MNEYDCTSIKNVRIKSRTEDSYPTQVFKGGEVEIDHKNGFRRKNGGFEDHPDIFRQNTTHNVSTVTLKTKCFGHIM